MEEVTCLDGHVAEENVAVREERPVRERLGQGVSDVVRRLDVRGDEDAARDELADEEDDDISI